MRKIADPTGLSLNMNIWQIGLSLAIWGFFTGLGSEVAKYAMERWGRKHLDKLQVEISKDGIEVTTKKTLKTIGNKRIYRDEETGEEYDNSD